MDKPNLNKPFFKMFPEAGVAIAMSRCPICDCAITQASFRSELHAREYAISGMCGDCQDNFFGPEED